MRFLRTYFLPILIAFAMLLFFTHDFGLIDIEHTAIIVAIGVDKNDDGYEVSTQIAIPQKTKGNVKNGNSLVGSKGKTIAEALDRISVDTGWYPLFAFCDLIVLGESTLSDNVMDVVNYFVRTDRVPDSASLCACEGSARKLLESSTPLDSVSSFALGKILKQDAARMDRIAEINVKKFAEIFFSKSECGYMPYVRSVNSENGEKQTDDDKSQESEKSSSSNSSSEQNADAKGSDNVKNGESEKNFLYDASETLVFSKGYKVASLTPEETIFFNLKSKNSTETFLTIDDALLDGEKTAVLLEIEDTKRKYSFSLKDSSPEYKISLSFECRIVSANVNEEISKLNPSAQIPDEVLKAAERKISSVVRSLFKKVKLSNCDLFLIKDALYKFHYSSYESLEQDVLSRTKLLLDVKCESRRSRRN